MDSLLGRAGRQRSAKQRLIFHERWSSQSASFNAKVCESGAARVDLILYSQQELSQRIPPWDKGRGPEWRLTDCTRRQDWADGANAAAEAAAV